METSSKEIKAIQYDHFDDDGAYVPKHIRDNTTIKYPSVLSLSITFSISSNSNRSFAYALGSH